MSETKTKLSEENLREAVKQGAPDPTEFQTQMLQTAKERPVDSLWERIQDAALVLGAAFFLYLMGISTGVLLAEREQRATIETWTEALRVMDQREQRAIEKQQQREQRPTPEPTKTP